MNPEDDINDPLFDPRASGDSYRGPGGYRNSADDADEVLSRIPIIGGGSRAALDARRAEAEADRNRSYWEQLVDYMPTADDLSVDYASEGSVGAAPSEWADWTDRGEGMRSDAVDLMTDWAHGGFTDADLAMMGEVGRAESLRARGEREASLSALEARGLGGSGMDLMARLGADEAAAGRASARNTTMLGAAQQRQLDATRILHAMGVAEEGMGRERRNALDSYNAREADYERGRENRNTDRENRGRESRADANQSAYENRERAVAGATNQYSTDTSRRAGENRREDEADDRVAGLAGAILENV